MADSYWIANDMIFVTGGKSYGIHYSGKTVCLGNEQSVKDILKTEEIPQERPSIVKETLQVILKIQREVNSGKQSKPTVQSGRKYRAGKARDKRVRLTPITKHQSNDFKRTLPGQRLSGGPADSPK